MALREPSRIGPLGGLIFSSIVISSRYQYSPTGQWPFLAILLSLFVCGGALLAAHKRHPREQVQLATPDGLKLSLAIQAEGSENWSWSRDFSSEGTKPPARTSFGRKVLQLSLWWVSWGVSHRLELRRGFTIALAVGIRAWILRVVTINVECAPRPIETALPFLLALAENFMFKASTPLLLPIGSKFKPEFLLNISNGLTWSNIQLLVALFVISLGAHLSAAWQPVSTFFCPASSQGNALQMYAVLLDASLIFGINRILSTTSPGKSKFTTCWTVFLSSSLGVIVVCIISLLKDRDLRHWAERLISKFLISTIIDTSMLSLLLISAFTLLQDLNASTITGIVVVTIAACQQIFSALTGLWDIMPSTPIIDIISIFCLFFGATVIFNEELVTDSLGSVRSGLVNKLLLGACILTALIAALGTHAVSRHPIDELIKEARINNDKWMAQATSSRTLEQTVTTYMRRYHRTPPPNFDKWFEYATERQSVVMDDYDQIWKDLAPFMRISPASIRNSTSEMIWNQWNDLGGVSIRNGKTQISPHIRGTHRWMFDGITAMIEKFSEHLPDMDLAFNLDDECRVAPPWCQLHTGDPQYDLVGTQIKEGTSTGFSSVGKMPEAAWMKGNATLEDRPMMPFEDDGFIQNYYEAGTAHCPPGSLGFSKVVWNPLDHCAFCSLPYSKGQFVANWTLSNDVCEQPDLANLHGFHLSPATFRTAHTLVPVFSQSKVGGYGDILYPSPWNYLDKVSYDPERDVDFEEKEDTLFWRGATSEGMATENKWRGMQRQRFVHLANNISNSTNLPLLIPQGDQKLTYTNVPYGEVQEKMPVKIDAGIVGEIARCHNQACDAQLHDLRIVEGMDFQEHWKYKYLMDMDGAGFSGRFIPFLQSGSVPVKAALFREWYDERLIPWLHFIPLDGRFGGLWSILAYFGGWRDANGREVVKNNNEQAKWIAEQGAKFARTMLRKEDMEIYFFRLLLEWGRMMDDRRDEIGFIS